MKKQTRWIAMLLAVVMLIPSLLVPVSAETPFIDVAENAWYAEAVNYVSENGYMVGVSDNTFAPNASVTRAMFVTVLARVAGAELDDASSSFADVPAGRWYTGAINWAAEKGIVNGVSAGKFAPNSSITRQDMCTVLYRYADKMSLKVKGQSGTAKVFDDDASIAAYAKDAVAFCSKAGVILGFEDNTFKPTGTATRAQMAAIILRLKDALKPFVSFSAAAGDLNVNVEAPEEALPANASMVVSVINSKKQLDEIAEKADGKVLAAVDISFHDITGEIEPNEEVEVNIIKAGLDPNSVRVVHIKDSGEMEPVENVEAGEEANSVKFSAKDFSVYAVIDENPILPVATVEFYSGENCIATVYVKEPDTREQLDDIVYDPGAGTLGPNQIFKGWVTTPNYTAETPLLTIVDIRNALDAMTIDENTPTVKYYAAIFKYYNITYFGESKDSTVSVSLGSDSVFLPLDETDAPYTVNMPYTPPTGTQNFEGWLASQGGSNIVNWSEGTVYPNGTNITITGDVNFSVDAPSGHWLVFNQNGDGATYVAPQFVKSGQTTSEPTINMVRLGYTFGGWYTDAACTDGNEFSFNGQLADNTTIYAKWTKHATADYSIIIWKQKITGGEEYDYDHSVTLNGNVDQTITAVTQQGTGNNAYARINGTDVTYTGFHLKDFDKNVTITPEGNTILNVYYDRNEYALNFEIQDYTYTVSNSNSSGYYYIPRDGGGYEQVYLYYNNGKWYRERTYNWGWDYTNEYTGLRYTRSNSQSWQTIKIITALYEQPIGEQFPIVGTNGVTYPIGTRWEPQDTLTVDGTTYFTSNVVIAYVDIMTPGNMVFRLSDGGNRPTRTMVYWVESINGQASQGATTTTYKNKLYEQKTKVVAQYYGVSEEDYLDFIGFDKYEADKNLIATSYENDGNYTYSNISGYRFSTRFYVDSGNTAASEVNFYYTRKLYSINFMDGSYFDGNGNRITDHTPLPQLGTESNIAYMSDVSSYNDYKPSTTPTGFLFEGWYANKECTIEYEFTTMPGGITVYAKWRQIQYRVFLHPQAGTKETDPSLFWGSNDQQMNFRISYGGKVSTPTGTRNKYEFIDWFTAPEGGSLFNAELIPLTEETVTADYNKQTDFTDDMDSWGTITNPSNSDLTGNNGSDRWWITKKLDLYARWRKVIDGAEGIHVIYNVGEDGTGEIVDGILYKDQANAVAQSAATPNDPSTKQFLYWIVQRWNGTTSTWENTSVHVYPGGRFTVYVDDAQVVDTVLDAQGNIKSATYNIQLLAEFGPLDAPKPSHIDWYSNRTTSDDGLYSMKDIQINASYDIPTPGTSGTWTNTAENSTSGQKLTNGNKAFLGWVRLNNDNGTLTKENGDAVNDTTVLTGEDLYLRWILDDSAAGGHYEAKDSKGKWVPVTKVFCDENTPYHDFYAVWSGYYFIYHSSTGKLEAVPMPEEGVPEDLTEKVASNTYYTGWFKACHILDGDGVVNIEKTYAAEKAEDKCITLDVLHYDGSGCYTDGTEFYPSKWKTVGDDVEEIPNARRIWRANEVDANQRGDQLIPKAGTVYYLRETPNTYFQSKVFFIYYTATQEITEVYLVGVTDDTTYKDFHFIDSESEPELAEGQELIKIGDLTASVASSVSYVKAVPKPYPANTEDGSEDEGNDEEPLTVYWEEEIKTETPNTLFALNGFVFVAHVKPVTKGNVFNFIPMWTTLDGAVVRAKKAIVSVVIGSDRGNSQPEKESTNSTSSLLRSAGTPASRGRLVQKNWLGEVIQEYVIELSPDYTVSGLN